MRSHNFVATLSLGILIACICVTCPFTGASYSHENEVLKITRLDEQITYPSPEEKQMAQLKGCMNGERSYFDGCNRCSCPNPVHKPWCSRRGCLRKFRSA